MSAHDVEVRQCPGWWPSLVQAVCGCGWSGPVRNLNDQRGRVLVRLDVAEHREGAQHSGAS